MTDNLCSGCGEPVLPGQLRYTAREPDEFWHGKCHDQMEEQLVHELSQTREGRVRLNTLNAQRAAVGLPRLGQKRR